MILITGGAGFIGSNLVAKLDLHAEKHDLVVCDRLGTDDKWRNIAKHEFHDFIRPEDLKSYLNSHIGQIHYIFHLGAISSTTERDADLIVHENFALSKWLWKWAAQNKVRFVYASSASTYGDGSNGFDDEFSPEALAKLRPLNPYGWSKHAFDRYIARQVTRGDIQPPQWAGLKFFNVYGPNEYHKGSQQSVVSTIFPRIIADASARLFKSYHPDYKDGGQQRDFVWVGDCIDVMLWLYENPQVSGVFNLGSGEARTFEDLALAVFTALGKKAKIEYVDMPEGLKAKYQYYTKANMDRLRAVGYSKPLTPLEEGVGIYVREYLATEDAYL